MSDPHALARAADPGHSVARRLLRQLAAGAAAHRRATASPGPDTAPGRAAAPGSATAPGIAAAPGRASAPPQDRYAAAEAAVTGGAGARLAYHVARMQLRAPAAMGAAAMARTVNAFGVLALAAVGGELRRLQGR